MPKKISFKRTPETQAVLDKIVDRALEHVKEYNPQYFHSGFTEDEFKQELQMDLLCVHNNTPLRLEELLGADPSNFIHDVLGIRRFLDRKTGELINHFVPRFTAH